MLMVWGPYLFETGGVAFDKLTRKAGGRWHDHDIIGRRPAGQYLGPAKQPVKISGVVFPAGESGVMASLAQLEAAAVAGEVYCLVSGSGSVSGAFRLEAVDAEESYHDANGQPGRVSYTLEFMAQDDGNGAVWSAWP